MPIEAEVKHYGTLAAQAGLVLFGLVLIASALSEMAGMGGIVIAPASVIKDGGATVANLGPDHRFTEAQLLFILLGAALVAGGAMLPKLLK